MARTDATKVGKVIAVDAAITDLTPFINAANTLVTELCVPAGYDADRLEQIETWLASHFYAIRDPRLQSEGAAGASGSYQGQTAMMLSGTSYGQQSMLLDTAGALASLNDGISKGRRPRIGAYWLGTEYTTSGE